jgi:predicted RNA binding protein YcfA (HicA-like mRNA interferase family)
MKQVSGKGFARILEKNGWKLARIRGSHHVYVKEGLRHFLKVARLKIADLDK